MPTLFSLLKIFSYLFEKNKANLTEKVCQKLLTICLNKMSDNRKEGEEKMAKAIFISGDGWLAVFDLLTPSQLGLGIALISHRFDFYVDEHFKTRRWALDLIRIRSKSIGNGTKEELEIVSHFNGKSLPIPQIQMPRKIIRFKRIDISYIDRNVIAFLNRFRPLFGACPFYLYMETTSRDRTLEFILRNIWPMIEKKISDMHLSVKCFQCLRKFVPSILTDCSSLRVLAFNIDDVFAEFPADDTAMASDGQALAKWLFTARPDDVPKELKCWLKKDDGTSRVEAFKAAFADASSPVNFIVFIWFVCPSFGDSVEPFELTNELTREHLVLKRVDFCGRFLLVRCPIVRDESKWEKEAIDWQISDQLQQINIEVYREDQLGDGFFDETPGPSDQQQK